MNRLSSKRKLKSLVLVSISGYCGYGAISIYKGNENFYKNYVMPMVQLLEPETAHKLAVTLSEYRLLPKSRYVDPDELKVKIFGKEFANPVGIAAGFDKDGKAILGLKDIGFGFVEVGSITPEPQPGNEKPRVFRLIEDAAVINRYGFNSEGHNKVLDRIVKIRGNKENEIIIGVNLGKNKTSIDSVQDYIEGIKKFGPVADYLVINISSPNTPGLRNLQKKEYLRDLLAALVNARNSLPEENKPPLLLKLAPDLTNEEKKDISDILNDPACKVDGLIVSNTTTVRPSDLKSTKNISEAGGLSGEPLKNLSTEMICDMKKLIPQMPIIGVGGISSGADAYEKIKAGASLVQIYTAMTYEGPPIVTKVKRELATLLAKDGYKNISDAVGSAIK